MDVLNKPEKKKDRDIQIDDSLEQYLDQPVFQEKLDKVNEMLEKFGLPDFEKLENARQMRRS